MSDRLAARAEVLKLARVLGTGADRLSYLDCAAPAEIAELREQAIEALFAEGRGAASRLAAASRPLPAQAAAKLGRALGPALCARVAAALEPSRALEVASHLPAEFLAEVAIHIDPRRARDVISGQPPEVVAAVTPILVEREEWVTMGRFLGALSAASIEAAVRPMSGEALVRTGLVTEDTERLNFVVAILSDEQLAGLVEAGVEHQLWPEALSLLRHFDESSLRRFAALEPMGRPEVLATLVEAAAEQELWLDLLPLAVLLPADSRALAARFAAEAGAPIEIGTAPSS